MHLLTSQLLIQSPPGSHRQGLDELRELDASVLRSDKRERERMGERKWPREEMSILLHTGYSRTFMNSLLFFHNVLAVFLWKRGHALAPSQLLFLPCTWLSPEAEICHLWSLVRWMLLAYSLKLMQHTNNSCIFGAKMFHIFSMIRHREWARQEILSNKVENIPLWHLFPLSFVRIPCAESHHRSLKFPITLPKLWPSAFFCEATLCAAERTVC